MHTLLWWLVAAWVVAVVIAFLMRKDDPFLRADW